MEMGFEPTRAEHNGLAVHRLNHSATPPLHYISVTTNVLNTCKKSEIKINV